MITLAEWAEEAGVSYLTAWRWHRDGVLPVPSVQPRRGGRVLVDARPEKAALYARVSSEDERDDLDRQLVELRLYCARKRIAVAYEATEICSGVAADRPKLLELIGDREIGLIVVVDRDRLAPRLAPLIEAALRAGGKRVIAIEEG